MTSEQEAAVTRVCAFMDSHDEFVKRWTPDAQSELEMIERYGNDQPLYASDLRATLAALIALQGELAGIASGERIPVRMLTGLVHPADNPEQARLNAEIRRSAERFVGGPA